MIAGFKRFSRWLSLPLHSVLRWIVYARPLSRHPVFTAPEMHSHAALDNGLHDQQRPSDPWLAAPSLPLYANGQPTSKIPDWHFLFSRIKATVVRPIRRAGSLGGGRSLTSSAGAPSPSNVKFVFMCSLWYTSSALSSNTGKAILNQFRYPVTLTFVQFGFVAFYCLLFMSPIIRFSRLRQPTKAILKSTIPMGIFQVGGHVFSSMAISTIPVSTVHTIKVSFGTTPDFGD